MSIIVSRVGNYNLNESKYVVLTDIVLSTNYKSTLPNVLLTITANKGLVSVLPLSDNILYQDFASNVTINAPLSNINEVIENLGILYQASSPIMPDTITVTAKFVMAL